MQLDALDVGMDRRQLNCWANGYREIQEKKINKSI